jgi:hypothetical protein
MRHLVDFEKVWDVVQNDVAPLIAPLIVFVPLDPPE